MRQSPPPRRQPWGATVHDAVTYSTVTGHRPLLLDLHVPDAPAAPPLVVWVHGGAFRWGDRRHMPPTLPPDAIFRASNEAGLAVATVDYRLSGEARYPAQRDDVLAAVTFLREHAAEYGADAGRLALWGESAGGSLAALAGLNARPDPLDPAVRAVACWYPMTDVAALGPHTPGSPEAELLGGLPEALPQLTAEASATAQVRPGAPPFLLVHGAADTTVPASQSVLLHEALLAHGNDSTLRLVDGAGHCFTGCTALDPVIAGTVAFLREHLTRPDLQGA